MHSDQQLPLHSRICVTALAISASLLASFTLTTAERRISLHGFSFTLSGNMLFGMIAVGLAYTGADAILRSHAATPPERLRRPELHSIVPTALTLAGWVLLARLPNPAARVAGVAATAGAFAVLLAAKYHAANLSAPARAVVEVVLQLAAYSVGALLLVAAHATVLDVHAAVAGSTVGTSLALRLLGEEELPVRRILWASLGIGLLLGSLSWQLHASMSSAITYSLTLVVLLYVLVGLARQALWGKLRHEVALEYALVALAGLLLVAFLTEQV